MEAIPGAPPVSPRRRRTYLLPDPDGEYARELIVRIFASFGLRPICCYTSARLRHQVQREHDLMRSMLIEDSVVIDDVEQFAAALRPRYDVVGVIPHMETAVTVAAELCRHLEIPWNSSEVLARFRNKDDLKRVLGVHGVRVPRCWIVESPSALDPGRLPDRFVIKPNDGYGNQKIGVFQRTELDDARAHLAASPATEWLLEEYIDGIEYSINGQVHSDGSVRVHGIFKYARCTVGSCQTVYDHEQQVPTTHPEFHRLVAYADAALRATGLRRSPFHLEVKVDDAGPCMIDLAARFGGGGLAQTLSRSHPGKPDLLSIAAWDYVWPDLPPFDFDDWEVHDRNLAVSVFGLATEPVVVRRVQGLADVEAMPEFVRWVLRPRVGDVIRPTDELYSTPFLADCRMPDDGEVAALVDRVRAAVRWTGTSHPAESRALRSVRRLEKLPGRLSWKSHQLVSRVRDRIGGPS